MDNCVHSVCVCALLLRVGIIQRCHCCHDDQSGALSRLCPGLHVCLWAAQADVGRVDLGGPGGLVALRQAGHPRGPHDRTGVVELRDWGPGSGCHEQNTAGHPPQPA